MFRCRSSVGVAACCCIAVSLSACRSTSPTPTLDDRARAFVRLAVALGEHDPDSLDFYSGPRDLVDAVRRDLPPLAAIGDEADALADAIKPESPRAAALAANARRLSARVRLLRGTRWSFEDERRVFFDLETDPPDAQELADARQRVDELLPGHGRLVDRYASTARAFTVPVDRWRVVFEAALDESRRRTRAHLPLPPNESVEIEFVHDRPWAAYSRYRGGGRSVIQLNTDFQLTLDQLLEFACHEAYPGHHTRSVLLDDARVEQQVQLTFSPAALVSEASAMAAPDIVFTADDRIRFERERLAPLASIAVDGIDRLVAINRLAGKLQALQSPIAANYLDGRVEFERTVDALEDQALVPHAEALVKYLNEYRSYVATYTDGARLFESRLRACAADKLDPWACYEREARAGSLGGVLR
jgi:hypothetical protein